MLHLVNYSFSGPGEAKRCLGRLGEEDHLLFIGNGVFSVIQASVSAGEIEAGMHRISIFALRPDLAARGIPAETLLPGVQLVDYSGFVELAALHGPVHSWFK
ncbi:MAG: sulfurtransferase complex subunit TusB [Methylococcaceae bacterium]|nr:sulfurtransferase complex subunit TusB [Methylococcaceae bacterium]MCI0734248.1 sulfurtransferase complex subunit TusB [Methylococcaceae bacterium]